jgi:hypothetical protein
MYVVKGEYVDVLIPTKMNVINHEKCNPDITPFIAKMIS